MTYEIAAKRPALAGIRHVSRPVRIPLMVNRRGLTQARPRRRIPDPASNAFSDEIA